MSIDIRSHLGMLQGAKIEVFTTWGYRKAGTLCSVQGNYIGVFDPVESKIAYIAYHAIGVYWVEEEKGAGQ